MAIHDLIRRGRLALKLSEQAFADRVGVTRAAVQQWERGTTAPRRAHQQAVANALGITIGELMDGESPMYPDLDTYSGESAGTQFSIAEEPTRYDVGLVVEIRNLLDQMSHEGQAQALDYLRYLAARFPRS